MNCLNTIYVRIGGEVARGFEWVSTVGGYALALTPTKPIRTKHDGFQTWHEHAAVRQGVVARWNLEGEWELDAIELGERVNRDLQSENGLHSDAQIHRVGHRALKTACRQRWFAPSIRGQEYDTACKGD